MYRYANTLLFEYMSPFFVALYILQSFFLNKIHCYLGYFAGAPGAGQLGMFNLLKSYSILDPEVGYCQVSERLQYFSHLNFISFAPEESTYHGYSLVQLRKLHGTLMVKFSNEMGMKALGRMTLK